MSNDLMSECFVLLGQWDKELCENQKQISKSEYERIITYFKKATDCNQQNISAWHYFAILNYESANHQDNF